MVGVASPTARCAPRAARTKSVSKAVSSTSHLPPMRWPGRRPVINARRIRSRETRVLIANSVTLSGLRMLSNSENESAPRREPKLTCEGAIAWTERPATPARDVSCGLRIYELPDRVKDFSPRADHTAAITGRPAPNQSPLLLTPRSLPRDFTRFHTFHVAPRGKNNCTM